MNKFEVGDRVRRLAGGSCELAPGTECVIEKVGASGDELVIVGSKKWWSVDYFELINDGPIRQHTITEIVPGTYGRLVVSDPNSSMVGLSFDDHSRRYYLSPAELTAAIGTLTAIRDALESANA